MNQIKLIIWDLDDTFWQGTLSESPITYLEKNHSIVVELTRRGIVNSIVSKNNHNVAKQVLENHGIWHYFVFPKNNIQQNKSDDGQKSRPNWQKSFGKNGTFQNPADIHPGGR